MKLKCDKKFPCSSCQKRGCGKSRILTRPRHLFINDSNIIALLAAICPDGCLVTGKGSRFVLSGSEELHERIDILTERIRELESGLGNLQTERDPNSIHPLLSEMKMKIKSQSVGKSSARAKPREHVNPLLAAAGESEEESEEDGPARHTGTLKIDERGTSTYFGSTARSEVCFSFARYCLFV